MNWKTLLKIVVSLGILVFAFWQAGIAQTVSALKQANLWWLPVGVLALLIGQLMSAYRWQLLTRTLGFQANLKTLYTFYLMGMYFSLFLPSAIGGDVGRMVYLAKHDNKRKREAFLTILAERGVGFLAILILTSVVGLTPPAHVIPASVRWTLAGMTLCGLLGLVVLRQPVVMAWVARIPKLGLLMQARPYWENTGLLVLSVTISLLFHGLMVLMHGLVAQAFGLDIPLLYLAMVYGVTSLISVMPFTINGLGLREGAYQYLLKLVGVAPEVALAFGIFYFLITTLVSLVGGLLFVAGHYQKPTPEAVEALEA